MRAAAAFALTVLALAAACDRGRGVVTLEVSPSTGPPGTVLTITGIDPATVDAAAHELFVGEQPAPFAVSGTTLVAAVPLFLGDDGWPAPPSAGQRVELRRDAAVVGRSRTAVAVTLLPESPGATASVVAAMADAAASLESLLALLPPAGADEAHARGAVFAMLRELLAEAERALESVAGAAERERDLLDAVLASTGALEYARELARVLAEARARSAAAVDLVAAVDLGLLQVQAGGGLCRSGGEDFDLACRMQVQVVLSDYTEAFVRPTASTYANTVGLAAGLTAIVATGGAAIPFAAIVGAILSVADFVMSKIVPALLPSRLSELELSVDRTTIDVGERTESVVRVTAVNAPPPISLLDVIEQAYALMGISRATAPKLAASFDEVMRATARFALDQYARVLRALDAAAPGAFQGVTSDDMRLPLLTWGPVEVRSDDLVTLFSFDEAVVASRESELEWDGVALGEASVRVMPRGPGERSTVLVDGALCSGCAYSGAAFGLDMPAATELLQVGLLELRADPPQGEAPLTTTFTWDGIPVDAEASRSCTLDPGDGREPYAIEDCATVTSQTHAYPYASGVRTPTGRYQATLAVSGTSRTAEASVRADWSLAATPASGDEPLDVAFAWRGFDPNQPLSCVFEPGDGTPATTIDDCLAVATAQHRFESPGGYAPTLIATGPARQDLKSVAVDVREGDPLCDAARAAQAWQGTVTMSFEGERRLTDGSVAVERRADVSLVLGVTGRSETSASAWITEADGSATIEDVQRRRDRPEIAIRGSGPAVVVTGGFSMSLVDCSVDRLDVRVDLREVDNYQFRPKVPAAIGSFEVRDVSLAGSATLPAYVMRSGSGTFGLQQGGTEEYGFGERLAQRWDAQVGTATVTWSFTPVVE